MKQLIKNAITYKAELPAKGLLEQHLNELPFTPVGDLDLSKAGFVPNGVTGELVTPIEGGLSFTIRYDQKIIPMDVVKERVAERASELINQLGRKLFKGEREQIKEAIILGMLPGAPVRTKRITSFYQYETKTLIIPVTSKKLADITTAMLLKAVGSIKAETIYISGIKQGLTTRLHEQLRDDADRFGRFTLGESVVLVGEDKNKVSYQLEALQLASVGILERLDAGFQVLSMGLELDGVGFKLTEDFHINSITFPEAEEAQDDDRDDAAFAWRHQAAVELLQVVTVVGKLADLFQYHKPNHAEQNLDE